MNVAALLALLLVMFACAGMQMFAAGFNGDLTVHCNFRDIDNAVFVLLRFSTGENFNGFMHDLAHHNEGCVEDYEDYQGDDPLKKGENLRERRVPQGHVRLQRPVRGHGDPDDPDATPCEPLQGCGSMMAYPYILQHDHACSSSPTCASAHPRGLLESRPEMPEYAAVSDADTMKIFAHWSMYDPDGDSFILLDKVVPFLMTLTSRGQLLLPRDY